MPPIHSIRPVKVPPPMRVPPARMNRLALIAPLNMVVPAVACMMPPPVKLVPALKVCPPAKVRVVPVFVMNEPPWLVTPEPNTNVPA